MEKKKMKLTLKSGSIKGAAPSKEQASKVKKQKAPVSGGSTQDERLSRVTTPLEAARRNVEIFSGLGIESNDARRQALISKRLKARRTLTLSPAPVPVTAQKSGIARLFTDLKNSAAEHLRSLDYPLLAVIFVIAVMGILAVHSASLTMSAHRRMDLLQIGGFFAGMLAIVLIPYFDYSELIKRAPLIFWLNVAILTITAIFGYNPSGESNESWLNLGFTGIQPAEISKVLFIITLSAHLEKVRSTIDKISTLLGILLHGAIIIGLVLEEQDWGNTLVFVAIFAVMLFSAKLNLRYIFGIIALAVISFPVIWDSLGDFRKMRVLVGFDPDLDPVNYGFQAIRSRSAIASGGLFGQGYMQGNIIQHPTALSEKQNDMIFAVIGQEFGFIGCAILLAAFAFLIYRIIKTAAGAKDYSGIYLCSGVAGLFLFQFIINIGMALGITPVIGITLPLVSYGTSSLLSMYAALALVMTVSANSYKKL